MIRIKYDDSQARQALLQARTDAVKRGLIEWAKVASKRVGARTVGSHMRNAKGEGHFRASRSGLLRIVSGRLARSYTGARGQGGAGSESIEEVKLVSATKVVLVKGSRVVYAGVHEKGATIRVTPRMRKYFWRQFYETRDERWKAMALSTKEYFTIPARPALEPAVQDELPGLKVLMAEIMQKRVNRALT